ncbi:MAG: Na/Pi cotransporter family protein [Peptococcaceae bacterium]|jgi:phosphate:Na+ symporter|nr:Na/Pi cotransporter family protein [Peptococcaceae bacterium]
MLKALIATVLGLTFLLVGMYILRDGLHRFAGSHLAKVLLKLTSTPNRGFFSGIVLTGFLQSSTALTVMAVSFVDAGLLKYQNALGLILGSNIGSTLTPQLLAFPLGEISVWLILAGLGGYLLFKSNKRYLLLAIAGLGTMFGALELLEAAMSPLVEMGFVRKFLLQLDNNYLYSILAGTVLSAVLHSSSAATGIAMILTEEGWFNLPASLAFIFGANIGTCFTALLVSVFTARAAQRVALFHVLLNVFGVVIFYPLIELTAEIISLLGGNLSRQVANAHTIFNLITSLLALPLLPYASRLLERLR